MELEGAVAWSRASFGGVSSVGSSSMTSDRWPWAAEARVLVIPSPPKGGMELCGRSRAGSIKRADHAARRGS
jgi:hypothetical protein